MSFKTEKKNDAMSCVEPSYVSFWLFFIGLHDYFLKQVPSYFNCLEECCNAAVFCEAPETSPDLPSAWAAMTEFLFSGELFL